MLVSLWGDKTWANAVEDCRIEGSEWMDNVLHGPEPLVYCKSEPWTVFPIIAAITGPQYFQDHKQGDSLNTQRTKINNRVSFWINRFLSALLVLLTNQ